MTTPFKLVSREMGFLGTLYIPDEWARELKARNGIQRHFRPRLSVFTPMEEVSIRSTTEIKRFVLIKSPIEFEAIELLDGKLEDLEQEEEVQFVPSFAYINKVSAR